MSKLSWSDVDFIRKNYKPFNRKLSIRALARKFGVNKTTIECIIHNKTWIKEDK